MSPSRRDIALSAAALALAGSAGAAETSDPLYGLVSQLLVAPNQRDAFARLLVGATGNMPGCLSYVVALDAARADALWITEVWTSREAHDQSLALPAVSAAMAQGRPMISGVGVRAQTTPLGGVGLVR
jgi:quinol monooxygenase YgiN